uniref:Uncharacterized protein n=1 Tax=Ciona intestinalis TaxID=7719 RepID=H2XYA1_CIOIN
MPFENCAYLFGAIAQLIGMLASNPKVMGLRPVVATSTRMCPLARHLTAIA